MKITVVTLAGAVGFRSVGGLSPVRVPLSAFCGAALSVRFPGCFDVCHTQHADVCVTAEMGCTFLLTCKFGLQRGQSRTELCYLGWC